MAAWSYARNVLLDARTLRGLQDGTVTLAFRRWTTPRVRVGTLQRTRVGVVEVTSVERVRPGSWRLTLREAMEFLTRKDYVDNWLSESHERFCDLTGPRWADLLTAAGFELEPGSGAWRNEWVVEHAFAPVAALHDATTGDPVDWPDTHVLTVARRPELA